MWPRKNSESRQPWLWGPLQPWRWKNSRQCGPKERRREDHTQENMMTHVVVVDDDDDVDDVDEA